MTTLSMLAVPARSDEDANLRPLPWRRMAWVTWRQHRVALTGLVVALAAIGTYTWIVGLQLHHAYAAELACHPAGSAACLQLTSGFNSVGGFLTNGWILQLVPALIGTFVGAPVLAREMETGSYRYAWTQGFGRWRWTLAKLAGLAVAVTAAASAISVLFSWYYQPYLATGHQALNLSEESPFSLALFDLRGVAFAAWTLVAFALGGLAGMLIRRVVPAIVATLAAYTGLALAAANLLRQHYLTPLLTSNLNVSGSAWSYSQWWTKRGKFAFFGWRDAPRDLVQACASPAGPLGKGSQGTLAQCFAQHGYTQLTSYQPASRFWPFQWIEGGWLLALSVLLIAVTVWVVRRRAV